MSGRREKFFTDILHDLSNEHSSVGHAGTRYTLYSASAFC